MSNGQGVRVPRAESRAVIVMRKRESSQEHRPPRRGNLEQPRVGALFFVALLLLFGLSGCHPVETWRHLTGASNNEPNAQTTPNSRNLAAGAKLPYPNLATVPPPPTRGFTEAQIKKLTRSLIADQKNARYTAEKLAAGMPSAPPPLPAAAAAGSAPSPHATAGKEAKNGLRPRGQPPQPGPMESSLTIPRIPAPPEPEAANPAPPPPHLTPPAKTSAPALAMLPPPARPAPPPHPFLPPPSAKPAALAAKPGSGRKAPPAKPLRLAAITFPPGVTSLTPAIKQQITTAAARFRKAPGTVRVVSYAAGGGGALAELNSFSAALAEGQAVAGALKDAGIPQNRIKVVASPTKLPFGLSRVEILLVP
jgi:outer membrane protein OmpA-like peptidoglycan-associated protein